MICGHKKIDNYIHATSNYTRNTVCAMFIVESYFYTRRERLSTLIPVNRIKLEFFCIFVPQRNEIGNINPYSTSKNKNQNERKKSEPNEPNNQWKRPIETYGFINGAVDKLF